MSWFIVVLQKYAVFEGRARRKEYWMFFLISTLLSIGVGIFAGIGEVVLGVSPTIGDGISILLSLALIVPSIAVGVRRMHDLGRSGWWIVLPLVNLVFLCMKGDPHENEYGPDPKAVG